MSELGEQLTQSMQEAVDFASGKADKSKYLVYSPADLPDTIDIKAIRKQLNMSQTVQYVPT